mmetsp:Transcript_8298/g.12294  ORF Transcript_8298/g.12294 Transcript_8298/m.12294 type:complete len:267 (-) Transcript_8298:956-1756(-)
MKSTKRLLNVKLVPVHSDNYAYILYSNDSKKAACVDPAEPKKVMEAAKKLNVDITHILTTHRHWDHQGGNNEMKKMIPNIIVVGSDYENVEGKTKGVKEGDKFNICGDAFEVNVIYTPCHTRGHILYVVNNEALFSGDCFFLGGAGKFFEGDGIEMYDNMKKVKSHCTVDTKMYCGHEYSVSNLTWANSIDPNNEALNKKLDWCKNQRSKNLPTIPSTLEEEYSYNPFFRVESEHMKRVTGETAPEKVMQALRDIKDGNRTPKETF